MSVAILLSARRRPRLALLLLTLLLIAASLVHLGLGARWIAPQTVLRALLEYDPRNFEQRIIIDLRLVRLAAALLTGAALGVAGLLLQTVIRNPLGEPHILGLNAGASLAVVATSALGLSLGAFPAGRPLTAACGAGLLFGGVMALASAGRGGATPLRITLCGVALSGFASAVTAAILILDEQTLLAMRTWLAGDLAGLNWSTLQTALVPALIGLGVALLIAHASTCWRWGIRWRWALALISSRPGCWACWRLRCCAARRWRWPGRSASSGWWCRTWCAVW